MLSIISPIIGYAALVDCDYRFFLCLCTDTWGRQRYLHAWTRHSISDHSRAGAWQRQLCFACSSSNSLFDVGLLWYVADTLPGIPKFSSHAEERKHILIHTAAVFRDFARKGFTEGISGHISVRDPEYENYIWMNPLGKHFGLMTAGDLICLDIHSGKVVGGNKVSYLAFRRRKSMMLTREQSKTANAAGFLIHSEVHKARPDVHAVCHAHTNAGRAWSTFATGLDMLNQDICYLYDSIAVYSSYGGIVFAEEEGRNIARALGPKNKVRVLPTSQIGNQLTSPLLGRNPSQSRIAIHG